MKTLKIDNSRRSSYVTCPRKFYYQYIMRLQSRYVSNAMRYGTVFHAAVLDGLYATIAKEGWTKSADIFTVVMEKVNESWEEETKGKLEYNDYRTKENLTLAFLEYMSYFASDEGSIEIVEPERGFKIVMVPSKEENEFMPELLPFIFTGRVDGEIKLNGRTWLFELKTTGQPLSIQVQRLDRTPQFIGYTYAGNIIFSDPPEGMLVTYHQLLARKVKSGDYGKLKIDFQRDAQIFNSGDIASWRLSFLKTVEQIQLSYTRNFWPMQYDSCFNYNTRCQFSSLCEQNRPPGEEWIDEERFMIGEEWVPDRGADLHFGENRDLLTEEKVKKIRSENA